MARDRKALCGLVALGAALALAPAACSKMGDRPPWWPQRPIGPGLLCEGSAKDSDPSVRDPAAIQAVVRSQYPAFLACYDEALGRDPEATGRMWTRFVIDTHGSVTWACLERADINDHDLGECLLETFHELRFPSAARDSTVVSPLTFEPGRASSELTDGPPPPRGREPGLQ